MAIYTEVYGDLLRELADHHNRRAPQSRILVTERAGDLRQIFDPEIRMIFLVPAIKPAFMQMADAMPVPTNDRVRMAFGLAARPFITGLSDPDYKTAIKVLGEEEIPVDTTLGPLQACDRALVDFLHKQLGSSIRETHVATLHGQTFYPFGHTDQISKDIFQNPNRIPYGFIANACIRGPGMGVLMDAPTPSTRKKINKTTFGELAARADCPFDGVQLPPGSLVLGKLDPLSGESDQSLFHWGTFGEPDRLGLTAFIGCHP